MTSEPSVYGNGGNPLLWRTFGTKKLIYGLVRTLPSASRLWAELSAAFAGDRKVQIAYVYCSGSHLGSEVEGWLTERGAFVISIEEALSKPPDLVITASEKADLKRFTNTPKVLLPHGLGFHKMVPDSETGEPRLSGLPADEILRSDQMSMLITHPDQAIQLLEATRLVLGRMVEGGDISIDELLVSLELQEDYRTALGVRPNQLLVSIGSTWGPESLLGSQEDLIEQLVISLPCDLYRVALFAHPNAWTTVRPAEVKRRYQRLTESGGLILAEPDEWQAFLLSTNVLVTDHGSAGLYGAMINIPILLATTFGPQVVHGTVMHEVGLAAQPLIRDLDLVTQIENARQRHDPAWAAELRARLIAHPGEAAVRLRTICYQKMGLEPDTDLPVYAVRPPPTRSAHVHAFRNSYEFIDSRTIVITRIPMVFKNQTAGHLVVERDERDRKRLNEASVLVDPRRPPTWNLENELAARPTCRMVAARSERGCEVLVRGRGKVEVCGNALPVSALAFVVYALLLEDKDLRGEFVVRLDPDEELVTIVPSIGP